MGCDGLCWVVMGCDVPRERRAMAMMRVKVAWASLQVLALPAWSEADTP